MYSLILHGKRFVDLQKWHNLGVSLKLLQKASSFSNSFSSSNASAADVSPRDGRKGQNFTVSSYLVDSLGLTRKRAESISRQVSSEGKGNLDSVLSLFRSHGFTDSQISSIITDYPKLLMLDAEKSLGPKLQFLQSRGASTSELTEIISTVPKILGKTGDRTVSRYYDFVKEVIEADKSSKFEKLCHASLQQGSKQENKIRNISTLRDLGVPQRFLLPLLMSKSPQVCGKEKFEESLKKVVEMGFDPTTPRFVQALKAVYATSEKAREEKVEVYKRLGFDVGDVWEMFKKWPAFLVFSEKKIVNTFETFLELGFTRDEFVTMVKILPTCIGLSTETVKKKIEFVVKQMNWPLKTVVSRPQVLGYSMEKRIVPRCNVLRALLSKGLLGDGGSEHPPLRSLLAMSHQDFFNKYVMKHDDKELVAELMAIFTGDRASELNSSN